MNESYDRQYARLKAAGLPGWGGSLHGRRLRNLVAALDRLDTEGALPEPPARVLELGCGNGMSALLMAAKGYEVHGIDLSETAIAWARERFDSAGLIGSFHRGDVCSMTSFEDRMFDVVMDGSCLHCLIDGDRARCLEQVWRTLRPAGTFIVSSMCGLPRSMSAQRQFDARTGHLMEDGQPHRTLKPAAEIEAEVSQAGFRIVRQSVNVNPWWDHLTMTCVRLGREGPPGFACGDRRAAHADENRP